MSALLGGCDSEYGRAMAGSGKASSKLYVAFVDVSGSIDTYDAAQDAWDKIRAALNPGDRVVLGRITANSYSEYRPILDVELPAHSVTDKEIDRLEAEKQILGDIEQALQTAIEVPKNGRPQRTDIFGALNVAADIFAMDAMRDGVLVLMSDMVEDTAEQNFSKCDFTPTFIESVIEERRSVGLLPDLLGARVYIVGPSGYDMRRTYQMRDFWTNFFMAANGVIPAGGYASRLHKLS